MARLRRLPAARPAQIAAIAALPDPAIITQNHWEKGGARILYANPMFCRLTGYEADELVGQNTHLLHGPKTDLVLLQSRGGDGPPGHQRSGEGWLCRKDGSPFFARWSFKPLGSPGGPSRQLVALYHDQSEVKHLREALLQSRKLDTVGLLAGGVAHDFNNLLSIINGYCEILREKIGPRPEAQEDLQEIHRAGLKAAEIARQILEFSRRQETEVKVVNYNTLIREIAEIIRRVAGDTVALELRLASDLANARIDPTQFQQVLLNLCFNAREAMPLGGQLVVRTYNYEVSSAANQRAAGQGKGYYAVMQVTDTGHGMEPGVLSRVFEPFFTTKPQGTGLGLATVLSIVRQHNGYVAVQSTPDQGTTFDVFLPETSEPEQTIPVQPPGRPPTKKGTESLLIIEEEEVLRKMIAGILVTEGYQVAEAATAEGAAAVIRARGAKLQLVLAPGSARGVTALVRRLQAKNRALRFINMAAGPTAAPLPGFSAQAVAHLPKPFTLSTLTLTVRALLDADLR